MPTIPRRGLKGRARRHIRIRKKVAGVAQCPRLSVFRSGKHIYAQVIDDDNGTTIASTSTLDKAFKSSLTGDKTERAKMVGIELANRCKQRDVTRIVFDRNGYRYHGRVRAVAEGAREGGLDF